jgi:sterol desaturase/sphingolipid hydroxylase (fatty acid hydroxylase superfamily)
MSAQEYLTSVAVILSVMAAVAILEAAVPLFARPATLTGRRSANLAMAIQALLFTYLLTSAIAIVSLLLPTVSPGLMAGTGMPEALQFLLGIVALDFAYGYLAHRAMHVSPALWKYHRVHHSDAFVDVTTSYRTHPAEITWRHAFLFCTVWLLGVPVAAVVAFRVLSAVNGILEHANIRVGPALDSTLSRVWVTPNMHKIHHSRARAETDSNYGNILSLHDRVFGTFVPTERAFSVAYGLDDVNDAEIGSFAALLTMPWRPGKERGHDAAAAARVSA